MQGADADPRPAGRSDGPDRHQGGRNPSSPGETRRGQSGGRDRRPEGRGTPGRPQGEFQQPGGPDERRRKRGDGERRATHTFSDGIERAFCLGYRREPPATFPVLHRQGIATLRPVVVDRRDDAILYCDGAHAGLHAWPNGEPVGVAPLPTEPGGEAVERAGAFGEPPSEAASEPLETATPDGAITSQRGTEEEERST